MKCALIGDPVETSISHITHNYILSLLGRAPEFRKIPTTICSLEKRLQSLILEGYQYIAVTMPLKEHVIPYIEELSDEAKKSHAVNFLDLQKRIGYNTDGIGGVAAIESVIPIYGKHICIMGSGGTAKAQAAAALQRGAVVYLLCRNRNTEAKVCMDLGCQPYNAKRTYDIIINATPVGMSNFPQTTWDFTIPKIQAGQVILDNVYHPPITPFLAYARNLGATGISGKEMFIHMALAQFQYMFGGQQELSTLIEDVRFIVNAIKN